MRSIIILSSITAAITLSACASSHITGKTCADLQKACRQAQDICETLEEPEAPAPVEEERLAPSGSLQLENCRQEGRVTVCEGFFFEDAIESLNIDPGFGNLRQDEIQLNGEELGGLRDCREENGTIVCERDL